jgi:hypothetical protein
MSIFYSNDVNSLLSFDRNKNHVTLDDIYSQIYNLDSVSAMKKSIEYQRKQYETKKKA